MFRPKQPGLPVYFIEVQFQRAPRFYANPFGKVFWYLEENDPTQEWCAVALFGGRAAEPEALGPYEDLLRSPRVKRIYLDEHPMPSDPPLGLSILQLVASPANAAKSLVSRLMAKAAVEISDRDQGNKVIELVEGLLLRRFTQLDREEIRKMFQLHDIRESKVWQEAHQEGLDEGKAIYQADVVHRCLAKGMSAKETAELMGITVTMVRRLAKQARRD